MTHKNKTCSVYGLYDSFDGTIRYIGQTVKKLTTRLKRHIRDAANGEDTPKAQWIRNVIHEKGELFIKIIKKDAVWDKDEIAIIREYKQKGFDLLNSTEGGQGNINPSQETRKKYSQRSKERWADPEYRERLQPSLKKALHHPARIPNLRKALSSDSFKENKRKYMLAAHKSGKLQHAVDKMHSAESRAKAREGLKKFYSTEEGKRSIAKIAKLGWTAERKEKRLKKQRETARDEARCRKISNTMKGKPKAQNHRDKIKSAIRKRAKLTPQDVRKIRKSKKSKKELAQDYQVSYSTIQLILANKIWKDI